MSYEDERAGLLECVDEPPLVRGVDAGYAWLVAQALAAGSLAVVVTWALERMLGGAS